MRPIEYNLSLLEEMLGEIEPFLLSSELFWTLGGRPPKGGPPYPSLSLGELLLTEDELIAQKPEMDAEQSARYSRLKMRRQSIWRKWLSTIQKKAAREMKMRLNLWRGYILDLEEGKRIKFDYPQEVRQRVRFERLMDLAEKQPEAQGMREQIKSLDERLQSVTQPAAFVWDKRLQSVYPKAAYWFLYRSPIPA